MDPNILMWRHISEPFTVPTCIHRCTLRDWESIDWNVAGCKVCGKIHECKDVSKCPIVTYEGRHVCQITGFFTRRNVFLDDEYVDTVANVSTPYVTVQRNIEVAQIEAWVEVILCSSKARMALQQEITKRSHRCKAVFLRIAKSTKAKKQPLNIVNICTLTVHAMSNTRNLSIMSANDLKSLAAHCTEKIDRFCRTFLDSLHCTPATVKMQGFVVGLLYLMRVGMLICGNIEIVPRVPELALVLPSENQVRVIFKLSTKIMTEVENIIKLTLRNCSREQLLSMGFKAM